MRSANFDPGKDVIDLSRIDANMSTAGVQNFTYIGDAPFSGAGAQVRWYTSDGQTYVQAKLAGETSADLAILLPSGADTLTSANFALTSNASSAALAAAAALKVTTVANSGGAREYSYSNVLGKSYSSYQSVAANGSVAAESFNMSATASQISVIQSGVTITRGSSGKTSRPAAAPSRSPSTPTRRSVSTQAPARRPSPSDNDSAGDGRWLCRQRSRRGLDRAFRVLLYLSEARDVSGAGSRCGLVARSCERRGRDDPRTRTEIP